MATIYSKLELYKRLEDGQGSWETTGQDITQFFNKIIKRASGSKKDTFKFSLMNSYNKYYTAGATIEKGDRIKIYQNSSNTFTDTELLIDGVVTAIKNQNDTSKMLTIEGKSRTEQFLEGLTFISNDTLLTPAEILENALNFHNNNNENFQVTWSNTNPSAKSDSTAFPTYYVEDFYKPMVQLFEKYSSNEYTKDGQYFYYINDDNEVIWNKKLTSSSSTLTESQCESVAINDNSDFVLNSIVINCGLSPGGKRVRTYYFDYDSRAQNGAKWKYLTSTNRIVNDLLQAERNKNPSSFDNDNSVFPNSYPYTARWGSSASSDSTWDDIVTEEAKRKGLEEGKAYAQGVNQSRLNVTARMPFNKDYEIMEVITCTFPSHNVNGKLLRVTDIQYTDYNTIYTLLEDEEV